MKRALIITYYWPPSGGPGVQRALKFAKFLKEFDVEPYVLTVDEKKASYPLIDESLKNDIPSGLQVSKTNSFEPLELYRRLNKQKEIPYSGFVNMDKTSLFQKIFRFIRGNFFIPDARVGWNKFAYRKAANLIENNKFSALITSTPPHSTQLVGQRLKRKYNIPWIADMRDPWTDIYYYNDFYHLPFIKKYDARLEKKVLENADAVIVVSGAIKRLFISKSDKINPDKIYVIPNGFDEEDFINAESKGSDEFIISYTGTLADQYPIKSFVEALKNISENQKQVSVKLQIVGKVSETIKKEFDQSNLNHLVEYVGYIPHKESVSYLMNSNLLLLVIPDIENNEGILTGKLFEYIGARKPILNIGPEQGDAAAIIEECSSGKTFDYNKTAEIYNYLKVVIDNWISNKERKSASNAYLKYSRRELTKKLSEVINQLEQQAK